MRIAHIAPAGINPYSGVLTVLTDLAAALAERGNDVELWQLSSWEGEEMVPFRAQLAAAGVETVAMPVRDAWRLGDTAALVAADARVDVVHLHNVFNLANARVARRLSSPYVVSPHGGYAPPALAYRRLRKQVFRRLVELPMLRHAAAVCALTGVEAAEVRQFGVDGPVAVIGNGTGPPGAVDRERFRRELGIGAAPLAVFVGRLDLYHKGLEELVPAVAEAAEWHLALVGPDFRGGRGRLEGLAAELGVADRVHVTGPRRGAELLAATAAADAFALPSRWEGFPVAVLEAAAAGTPALVSPAVEERIGIAAAGGGRVVPAGGWGAALRHLGEADPDGRAALRAAAARFAAERSWDAVAGRYEDLYRQVAAG